jgi:hypothetical protein
MVVTEIVTVIATAGIVATIATISGRQLSASATRCPLSCWSQRGRGGMLMR